MIELKNVSKIYKSKKATDTLALNNVSFCLPNKGLVFILGKSGSGKSTLLNLLGGLDNLSSGEIIVNDKKLSSFKKNDYDSYRNTYIGFVFQEFNVLEQYNVYENIELAVQLQKTSVDKNKIDELLNKLGIEELGNRKINELSGGQKQRVAIARALIKKPKIILADEPTGNLDSESSAQIFNILKEISKEQLVIVVSHDDDSAMKYADRILRIEDGMIIEDKKNNEIELYNIENFNLKKSKLPLFYTLKMAFNSLKSKPLKLVMTIILTALSLIFMGFTVNCALFDESSFIANTMRDNEEYVFNIFYQHYEGNGAQHRIKLEKNNLEDISKITDNSLNVYYTLYDNDKPLNFIYGESKEISNNNFYYYYEPNYFSFVEVTDDNLYKDIIGRKPNENNEIVIHKYVADYMMNFGVTDSLGNLYFPKSYDEFVKSKNSIKLGDNNVIVVGIINDDDSLYKDAKETGSFKSDAEVTNFQSNYLSKSNYIYVNGFTNTVILNVNKELALSKISLYSSIGNSNIYPNVNINALKENVDVITPNGFKTIDSLKKDEVLITIDSLKEISTDYSDKLEQYLKDNGSLNYNDLVETFTLNYLKEKGNLDFIRLKMSQYFDLTSSNVNVKVIGITLDEKDYVSNNIVLDYEPITKAAYGVRMYEDNHQDMLDILKHYNLYEAGSKLDEIGGDYYQISMLHDADMAVVISTYDFLYKFILIVALVFVLFTILLFSNFIAVSILYCKKEIGILRAIGARENDIIKIFAYESIIIGIISWLVCICGWYIACYLLNHALFGNYNYVLNGIVTHPLVPIGTLIYTLLISISITILSITRITSIKPIDAINNK